MAQAIKIITVYKAGYGRLVVREQIISPEKAEKRVFNCGPDGRPVNQKVLDVLGINYNCA